LEGVNLWDKRQEMEDEQFTPVVSTLVSGIPFYEQLGWWRRGCALSWDDWTGSTSGTRGRRWRTKQFTLEVSTIVRVPGIPFYEQLGGWRRGCALSWDDWTGTGSTFGTRGRR
jgi:hypothetical protein